MFLWRLMGRFVDVSFRCKGCGSGAGCCMVRIRYYRGGCVDYIPIPFSSFYLFYSSQSLSIHSFLLRSQALGLAINYIRLRLISFTLPFFPLQFQLCDFLGCSSERFPSFGHTRSIFPFRLEVSILLLIINSVFFGFYRVSHPLPLFSAIIV